MARIKILISYHKDRPLIHTDILTPIHVGRGRANSSGNGLGDNTGENISSKNPYYAEMTAMFWAWKNYAQLGCPDYIGFFHYRRFLNLRSSRPGIVVTKQIKDLKKFGLDGKNIGCFCKGQDLVVPYPDSMRDENNNLLSIKEHYEKSHVKEDFDLLMDILRRRYPEHGKLMEDTANATQEYCCNIFIMRKELFFRYCEFCFGILFEMEERSAPAEERFANDIYQKRVYGFLAERLLNFFIAMENNSAPLQIKGAGMVMIQPDLSLLSHVKKTAVVLARKAGVTLYKNGPLYKISFGKFILAEKSDSHRKFLNGLIRIK